MSGSESREAAYLTLRRATLPDALAVADLYLASFNATYTFPLAHSDAQVRDWIRDVVIPDEETWVAVDDGLVVGMLALTEREIDQLYVAPKRLGVGIGSRLVDLAKERRPAGLGLYTFQLNARARRFYERRGFAAVAESDGAGNDERQPDIRFEWRPRPE